MTRKSLRIALTVDPEIPVPPVHYGGIERIVNMLVCELQKRGHELHLFAHRESRVDTHLVPYPAQHSQSPSDSLRNMTCIWTSLQKIGGVDIIHSFSRLVYLLPWMRSSIPKIQSYQRFISARSVRLGVLLAGPSLTFTSCSASNAVNARQAGGQWDIIYNGVETGTYQFKANVPTDAPLVFLGRVERIKGVHTAIEVARKTGRRLIIAGNHAQEGSEAAYFQHEILPSMNDQIQYIGPVDDAKKNELLGNAGALLFPIEWEEPFGIVMVEALACGTPIIGLSRGAVPEVIEHGRTGFICQNSDDLADAVQHLAEIDRTQCRQVVEERFSATAITDAYEKLYYSVLSK